MKRYNKSISSYSKIFESEDLNELIGYLKGRYKSISQVKSCPRFKVLSDTDEEYVLDELKAEGFR